MTQKPCLQKHSAFGDYEANNIHLNAYVHIRLKLEYLEEIFMDSSSSRLKQTTLAENVEEWLQKCPIHRG